MNHAKIFCKSCSIFCEISLLVKFSRIVFKNVENAAIHFLLLCVLMFVLVMYCQFLYVLV